MAAPEAVLLKADLSVPANQPSVGPRAVTAWLHRMNGVMMAIWITVTAVLLSAKMNSGTSVPGHRASAKSLPTAAMKSWKQERHVTTEIRVSTTGVSIVRRNN